MTFDLLFPDKSGLPLSNNWVQCNFDEAKRETFSTSNLCWSTWPKLTRNIFKAFYLYYLLWNRHQLLLIGTTTGQNWMLPLDEAFQIILQLFDFWQKTYCYGVLLSCMNSYNSTKCSKTWYRRKLKYSEQLAIQIADRQTQTDRWTERQTDTWTMYNWTIN